MLKVLTHLRTGYPPNAKSGADMMAERLCTWLAQQGCDVTVIADVNKPYEHKGVKIRSNKELIGEQYDNTDVVLSNLVMKSEAVLLARRFNKPLFHLVHNDDMAIYAPQEEDNYIVFNSHYLFNKYRRTEKALIVWPPTWQSDWHKVEGGKFNTLVNCAPNKGPQWIHSIAQDLPREQFLGVHGGYGVQFSKPSPNNNFSYHPFTPDIQQVYNKTRVLLIASQKETWSMCAAEAQCCGIPVVSNDLPGVKENLGTSGIFAGGKRPWLDALSLLRYPSVYKDYQERGWARQAEREIIHHEQLNNLLNFMLKSCGMERNILGCNAKNFSEKIDVPPAKEKKEVKPPAKKEIKKPGIPVK